MATQFQHIKTFCIFLVDAKKERKIRQVEKIETNNV